MTRCLISVIRPTSRHRGGLFFDIEAARRQACHTYPPEVNPQHIAGRPPHHTAAICHIATRACARVPFIPIGFMVVPHLVGSDTCPQIPAFAGGYAVETHERAPRVEQECKKSVANPAYLLSGNNPFTSASFALTFAGLAARSPPLPQCQFLFSLLSEHRRRSPC